MGDQLFPFVAPEGSDADMFIQWKGTDVCLDFVCQCGRSGHFDGLSAYGIRCACGAVYEMGTQVIARRNDEYGGNIVDLDMDEVAEHRPPLTH